MKATIFEIGEAAGIIIPKDVLERLGWKIGDLLNLRIAGNVLDVRSASSVDDATDDFDRQLEHSRRAMRKYHVALKTLAKS